MTNESPQPDRASKTWLGKFSLRRIVFWAMGWGIFCGLAIILPLEYDRLRKALQSDAGWLGWLMAFEPDTTLPLFVFLLLPLAWNIQKAITTQHGTLSKWMDLWLGPKTKPSDLTNSFDVLRAVALASIIGGVSLILSFCLGSTAVEIQTPEGVEVVSLSTLPPALHDEYSYLFQAKTFLAGRLAYASHPKTPGLFDQMHVLNDKGVYASRYFPGTGIWMVPFVALQKPYWGHWVAGALSAVFVFFIGRELAGNAVGFLAGLLAAVSPGIQLFGQLLLAHHTTLLGVTFFAWMFLRMMRTRSYLTAAFAGVGLAFAMICRPMSAAGIGLPFGVWLIWWWFGGDTILSKNRQNEWSFARRSLLVACLGLPIFIVIGGMLLYNSQVTGEMLVTPYQLYTDIYTPRHVYGFNNVERAASNTSEKIIENYDQWAENLTPELALQNVKLRLIASGQWVLGMIPLAMSIGVFPFLVGRSVSGPRLSDSRWWLVLLAAVSIHVAHIPYWFVGIRHWHYVFEAAPFFLLIFAGVFVFFFEQFWTKGYIGLSLWWVCLLFVSLWIAYGPLPGEAQSRVQLALQEDIWARRNYAVFNQMLDRVVEKPALVLVAENPSDRHIDYVTNVPSLDTPIIRGRFRPKTAPLDEVLRAFPDRSVSVVVLNPEVVSKIENGQYPRVRFEKVAEEPIIGGVAHVYRLQRKQ